MIVLYTRLWYVSQTNKTKLHIQYNSYHKSKTYIISLSASCADVNHPALAPCNGTHIYTLRHYCFTLFSVVYIYNHGTHQVGKCIQGLVLGGMAFFIPVFGIEKIPWYLLFHGILAVTLLIDLVTHFICDIYHN